MIEIQKSAAFDTWLARLRDTNGRARILDRLDRLAHGQFGDTKSIGGGLSELRMPFGPGYRIYYLRHGQTLVVLLCGGDKGSQDRDIRLARKLADEWSER